MNGLILGRSRFGKSTLAKKLCSGFTKAGRRTLVLDIIGSEWDASYVTDDYDEYLDIFWGATDLQCFVDEGGETAGKRMEDMKWTATRGSHQVGKEGRGNSTYYIAHKIKTLDTTLRDQCPELFLFATGYDTARDLVNDYGAMELKNAPFLKVGEFYHVSPYEACGKWKINQKTGIMEPM